MPTAEESIQTKLQAILAAVTGVKKAYLRAPMSIPPIDLPAVLILPGRSTKSASNSSAGWLELTREYSVRFYVTLVQAGITGSAETTALPFIERGMRALLARPAADDPGSWTNLEWISDSGIAVLPTYAGEMFLGVEHRISIRYRVRFTYAAQE